MSMDGRTGGESLDGCRILVVDDEFLVALLVEDVLQALGCEVIGPASRIPNAVSLAQKEPLDFAILDVNVAGEKIFPVAEILSERRIPFIFLTGYGRPGLDGRFPEAPVLQKPFREADLVSMLRAYLPT
ncbi:response regulator [Azospirillum doebereinerae]